MMKISGAGRLHLDRDGGAEVQAVDLSSEVLAVRILGLGAALASVEVPDSSGRAGSVHLGLPDLASYADHARNPHFGSSIGRYANRIAGASFELDGERHELLANSGPNTLHGGPNGWDRHVWDLLDARGDGSGGSATFGFVSPDGDAGFPGRVVATATYTVVDSVLRIEYSAHTDSPTVVCMTNHSYWNLAGGGPVDGHRVTLAADEVLPVDGAGIPTGGPASVEGTPFDLRTPTPLGPAMAQVAPGFDHCFAVRGEPGVVRPAAILEEPTSGRWLTVSTDQRGVQLYTGNNLAEPFDVHGSVSLETQAFPDSPNRPELGSVRLDPDSTYGAITEVTFGTGDAPALTEI